MSFDINGARNEGYTDSQIADHLAGLHGYDAAGARAEGYADAQIAEHLASRSTTLAKAKNAAMPSKSVADMAGAAQSGPLPDSIQSDPTRIVTTTADRATDFAVNKVIAENGIKDVSRPDDSMAETSRFLQGDINESPQARIDKLGAESAEGMARNTATPEQQAIYDRANAATRDQLALDKNPVSRGVQRNSGGTIEAPVEALAAARRRDAPATSVTSDVAEVGKQLAAGGIDLVGMAGKSGQAMSGGKVGGDLEKWAEDKSKGWEPDVEGRGGMGSAFVRGARSVVPSLAASVPYLLAGGVGIPTKIAMALGDAGTIALFGGSAYTDTKRKIDKQNPFGKNAWQAGVLSVASQGGLEVVQNRFTLGLLGASKGVAKETMNAMVGNAVDKSVFKPFAAAYGKAMVGEPGTEAIQDTATELTERAYGARPTDLWEMAKDSITATMGMVTLTAPFGLVGHYRNAKQAAAIDEILSNPAHPIEARQSVVDMLYKQGVAMQAPDAAIWLAGAKTDIDNNRPIRRDAGGNADPAQADVTLGAAVHGAISAEAVLGTPEPAVPFPNAAPGSLSSAANVAAKHGLTPQNASILPTSQPTQEQNNASQTAQAVTPETQQQTQELPANAIAGHPSEVVLPDNTALPAQWEVVDADQVTATLKEGQNQPRDRSRATSDVQVNGIANAPDYRRLSDSPVMDVGAPTLSMDGAIVGGNGRFEGVSRAYDQGTASEYLARLNADAQAKGIDPASFAGMKKPVLVRRITQPLDTRAVAVASNSGGSLQYSALELAKIDGERMATLGDIEVNDAGDIEMTTQNMQNVRRALAGYGAAELGSMADKDGMLSQEGIRRLKNAMMYKAYGNSPTLSRLVESTDNELRSVSGALVRAAGAVAGVRADMAAGAVPSNADIAADLVVAVELLSKIKSGGGSVEQYLAQHGLFKGEYTEAAATILRFLSENIRSQKRMAEFIRAYYDALASEDTQTGSMFEDLAPATKQERLNHAKQQTEAGTEKSASGPAGVAGAQDQQQPKGAQSTAESGGDSQQAEVKQQGVTVKYNDWSDVGGGYQARESTSHPIQEIKTPDGNIITRGRDTNGKEYTEFEGSGNPFAKGGMDWVDKAKSDLTKLNVPALGNGTQSAPIKVESTEHLRLAEQNVNTAPTDAQKENGNYAMAHIQWNGLDITIENPKGSKRSGKDADGEVWSVTMPASYGYIKRTEGADGEHIDVYLGEDHQNTNVYVIDQIHLKTGEFDEHKVMLGFSSLGQAERTYKAGFSDDKGAGRMGAITPMSLDEFKVWTKTEDTTKPLADLKLTSPTAEGLAQRERAAEQAKTDEEAQAKKAQADKDAADIAARTEARVSDSDNFQFGESSKEAAKPVGDLFAQPAAETEKKARKAVASVPSLAETGGTTEWIESYKKGAQEKAQPAEAKPENPLASALRQYEDTGELATVGDLVSEVRSLIDDDQAPASLKSAIEDYRQEAADDHEMAGRGDMESADEAFISAVRSAIADADMDAALNDLGAILRDVAGVKRIMPEDHEKLLPVLVKLFDAAFRKGYYDLKAAARYVRKILAEHDATKAFAKFIPNALMDKAAKEAASKMPDGFFENQGLFTQAKATQTAAPISDTITISDIPATLKIKISGMVDGKTKNKLVGARAAMQAASQRVLKLEALLGCMA